MSKAPGPAEYKLPTTIGFANHDPRKERKPMYTMRGARQPKDDLIGPGPAGYGLEKLTRTGKPHNRMYTMGARLALPKQDQVPGPGAHNNHRVPTMTYNRAPLYTFGRRLELRDKDMVPGPDRYDGNVRKIRPQAPSYTMRQRTKELGDLDGPGPAKYALPSCHVTRNRAPNYTMRGVHQLPVERTENWPGPSSYGLMNLRVDTTAPSYTFGIRYPDSRPPMIIPGDNC